MKKNYSINNPLPHVFVESAEREISTPSKVRQNNTVGSGSSFTKPLSKLILFCAISVGFYGYSQPTQTLDKNNISLIASAEGHLFHDAQTFSAGYEVPKGSGVHSIYSLSFWYGAKDVSDQLRTAAQTLANDSTDFFPGPFSSNGSYDDPNYLSTYIPALWKVSSSDIDNHIAEYINFGFVANPVQSILNWPANGDALLGTAQYLAPFVDVNSDGIYDPYAGDFPQIKGCEALYIIMNDGKDAAGGTMTENLDIEIHIMLYQYDTQDFLNDVTFMDTRVINRGTDDLYEFVTGTYIDVDLGNSTDDYVGTDVSRNLIYGYNGFDTDALYGSTPPALGVMYLNDTIQRSGYFINDAFSPTSDPVTALDFWRSMHGYWNDGEPVLYGGNGYPGSFGSTTTPSAFMYPRNSDPNHAGTSGIDLGFDWTEYDPIPNVSGDRKMFLSAEQGTLLVGQEFELNHAIVFGRDLMGSSLGSVDEMLAIADSVQQIYDTGIVHCNGSIASIGSLEDNNLIHIYPNPATDLVTITVPIVESSMFINVVDMYGHEVYSGSINSKETQITLNGEAGIYFVTIRGSNVNRTVKVIKQL